MYLLLSLHHPGSRGKCWAFVYTVMILNFRTDRSGQTMQTQIRLLRARAAVWWYRPTSSTSHFLYSHFVYSHFVYSHFVYSCSLLKKRFVNFNETIYFTEISMKYLWKFNGQWNFREIPLKFHWHSIPMKFNFTEIITEISVNSYTAYMLNMAINSLGYFPLIKSIFLLIFLPFFFC